MKTGLVSITFRQLNPTDIVSLVVKAGLDGIEWGGDIHVPHGDLKTARQVGSMTRSAGLAVSSYGSYYRAVTSEQDGLTFGSVLATARELAAPVIRVWAGSKGSGQADAAYRQAVAADLRRAGELAAGEGISVALESHGGTLTDTTDSALLLIGETGHSNVKLYWQPNEGDNLALSLRNLERVLPHLSNVHAFHWRMGPPLERLPLAEGKDVWRQYLERVRMTGRQHWVLLEFVRDDSPEQFLDDAEALKRLERITP